MNETRQVTFLVLLLGKLTVINRYGVIRPKEKISKKIDRKKKVEKLKFEKTHFRKFQISKNLHFEEKNLEKSVVRKKNLEKSVVRKKNLEKFVVRKKISKNL
jgi:hypothetical protein